MALYRVRFEFEVFVDADTENEVQKVVNSKWNEMTGDVIGSECVENIEQVENLADFNSQPAGWGLGWFPYTLKKYPYMGEKTIASLLKK